MGEKFVNNQGKTSSLSTKLCNIFEIPDKNIEVSKASVVTSTGIMMYLVHFMNCDDMHSSVDPDINDIKKMYKKNAKKVNNAFKKQFCLKGDKFNVGWKRFADDTDEDETESFKTEIFDVVKSAMTFMDLDFNALPARQRFLTQYLLMDEKTNDTERRSLIEEIVEEQKANESEGSLLIEEEESDEGLIGTINETQM